jgi:ketosteroid isomerase-like protein
MNEQQNVEKLQQMYAAFGRGDIATLLENVTDDVTWGVESVATDVPWYSVRSGRDGVAEFFELLAKEVEFTKFEPTTFAASGDEVLVSVDYDFRFRKNGQGMPVGVMHRFRIRDGKVSSFRAYEDTAAIQAAWVGV